MIRGLLGALLTRAGTYLTPPRDKRPEDPVFTWLNKMRRDFKKKRLLNPTAGKLDLRFNPLAIDEDINCPCHYAGGRLPGCPFHPERSNASEELAFLEWLESKGINLPKKDILKNDGKWRSLDIHYNPLDNDEDFFISQQDVA